MAVITPGTSEIHRLNGPASDLFHLCAGEGQTLAQLIHAVTARYEVDATSAEDDVRAFLQEALDRGLLEEITEPEPAPSP